MERGFVKLWRKSADSGLMQNPKIWVFWTWCLMKASHKKRKQMVGMQMVELEPGDFIFGRKAVSKELKISERTIRTCVQNLKKLQNLTIKTTNKFSVISIVNWDSYQGLDCKTDQLNDQQVTSKRPTSDQQVTTDKNVKNENNERMKEKPPLTPQGEKSDTGGLKRKLKIDLLEKIEINGFLEIKDQVISFFEYRMSKPKAKRYQTEKGINGLFRDLGGCRAAGLNVFECMEIAMENNWQAPKLEYFKNNGQAPGARYPNGTVMGSKRMDGNVRACIDFIEED